ncbi:TaqI-like C-terminal specificity domain-containing protein [Microcoleus sp. AT9b-C4]|uniref:Eco57I restriction-modification methylase domain-containing protein n=1 Tax=Microcoleus sp. AT9b-C4 TaxID=2818630 RepID=UPI002FD34E15
MSERLLQLDDLRTIDSPEKIASMFRKLGYVAETQPLNIEDLQLSARNTEAITETYLIANQGNAALQVLLFQLEPNEWVSPSTASTRMKAIASQLGKRATEFLLLATKDYNQLMLVNPRKTLDEKMNVKASIRKLLIDRTNPTAYDRDRLEAIAAKNQTPLELYKTQCEAFDVEKLTKQFYRGYKELFDRVQAAVKKHNPHSYFNDSDRLHQFSQRLLGRVMFLYFLQKKEFLAGDRRFLTKQYEPFRTKPDDTNYYGEVLEPLFFETLNAQRPNFESRWGKIPYLNGGLFDRDYGAGIRDAAGRETPETITLPNSLFDPGSGESILGFFNNYNFTVSENVAGDEDVAVDPEMLGKVFENMLAAEERGQSGTFYTPRGIVQFMCAEVLTRYLVDESGMDLDAVRQFVEYDPDLSDADFNQLMSPQQARSLKKAVENIKVLDPAVGSGAFPLGMMQTILQVRQAIARREGMTVQRGSLTMSEWKREIIGNNLYGVDIKPESIEIAKLRMWLSLVVDIPNIDNVEPLPNLDYKLMCGDSLISTIYGERLIPDPTKTQQGMLAVTPIQQAIQPLLELQHRYFDAQTEERHQLRTQILETEANVFRVAVADRRQYWVARQQDLERKIKAMKGKVSKLQEKELAEIAAKLAELDRFAFEVETGERSLHFFQYHLHFNDVFKNKGGFDIVIGNPPYVRYQKLTGIRPMLQQEYECYSGAADLYVYFYERGINLLHEGGHFTYISSNKFFRSEYGKKLRKLLLDTTTLQTIIDFGDTPVFEAIAYPTIVITTKVIPVNSQLRVLNWQSDKTLEDFEKNYQTQFFLLQQKELNSDNWQLEPLGISTVLEKLKRAGQPLGMWVGQNFYTGIITSLNEAYVVDKNTRNKLIDQHSSSAELLHPFLRGKDVKRWSVDFSEQYLIKIESSENKHHPWSGTSEQEAEVIFSKTYPAIYQRFLEFRERLINRDARGKYFWELRSCAFWNKFEKGKIIAPIIAKNTEFAVDFSGHYSNDKTSFWLTDSVYFLLGILNSKVVWWFIRKTAATKQGGFYEFKPIYVSQIPIPTAPEPDRLAIEALVQKCLDAKGVGVEEWEAEIDDRVAYLYGLTDEEMKIIRKE